MLIDALRNALQHVWLHVQSHLRDGEENEGQGLVEYALILVLVAVAVIAVLTLFGPALGNVFSNIVCGVLDVQNIECQQ
jgi:pilus assembly protein Flp/PilA